MNFVLLLALSACGGGASSNAPATYQPPATPGGRMCVLQCDRSRDYCSYGCGLDYNACFNQAQTQAQSLFDQYAAQRYAHHLPIDRLPGDFRHSEACDAAKKQCAEDCERPYDACYRSCDGAVIAPAVDHW